MVEVDNLHRTRKIWIGKIPDPFGSVADDNLFGRAIPSAGPGFQIDTFAKLFGGFNGAGVGGGIQLGRATQQNFGSVADDNLFGRAIPSAGPGFQIDTFAKLFGGFNGAGVGGGIRIADRISLLVPCGLSKNTSQLGFPRVGRLAGDLAAPSDGFFLHYRYTRPVHLDIEDGDWLGDDYR